MDWEKIGPIIQKIIDGIKKECIIQNTAIRDDIFGILENRCTVIYYPLEDEKNRGFHIKRIVKDKLEDFVYINTAKPMAEQIFAAAHEFGHIWEVAGRVWEAMGYQGKPTGEEEEDITNRFAAELLMPANAFREVFRGHMKELEIKPGKVLLEDVVRVMVLQMGDFMVPYESVRKRLVETNLMQKEAADYLLEKEEEALKLVAIFTKDQNTYLGQGTGVKTISGIRMQIEKAENQGLADEYLLKKIKKDFNIADMPAAGEKLEIVQPCKSHGRKEQAIRNQAVVEPKPSGYIVL